MSPALVDTNILVYAHDRSEPAKQERAIALLDQLGAAGNACLSTQVLGEFYTVATRPQRPLLSPRDAAEVVIRFCDTWPVLSVSAMIVAEALRGARLHRLGYWDAQLWATARLHQVPAILSEDFSHRRRIEGVTFWNPFTPGFEWDGAGAA